MTREDKELLFKDLCARLPYDVKGIITYNGDKDIFTVKGIYNDILSLSDSECCHLEDFRPYLFPISSMTDMQKKEYNILRDDAPTYHYEFGDIIEDTELYDNWVSIDYLNAHHFDFRGLIKEGLALDATGLNIYS